MESEQAKYARKLARLISIDADRRLVARLKEMTELRRLLKVPKKGRRSTGGAVRVGYTMA